MGHALLERISTCFERQERFRTVRHFRTGQAGFEPAGTEKTFFAHRDVKEQRLVRPMESLVTFALPNALNGIGTTS